MSAQTHDVIAAFGSVEGDQRYTQLVDRFTDDAVYYDPFFGPQNGKAAIHEFMTLMEKAMPASGAYFADWRVSAGTDCGSAQWHMVAPDADGVDVWVPGESLYRLRDGKVLGVVDYVDPVAYNRLRGDSARIPNFIAGTGVLPESNSPTGPVADELRRHVASMSRAGRWAGAAELIDVAGETETGWAQWILHGEHGDFAGWSLRQPSGAIRDLFDTVTANNLSKEATP